VPAHELPESVVVVAKKLPRKFYFQDTVPLAKALLGKRLVRVWRGKRLSGIIVETEAYLGEIDAAAHTYKGRTERNRSMYLEGGHAYVYFIYGMHYCINVVAKRAGEPEAVLLRALAPEPGSALAGRTDGPGRLCKALRITKALDGVYLGGETVFIEDAGAGPRQEEIGAAERIGVDYAGEAAGWPLRFYWKGSPYLSRKEKQ
jgi:DNA-3-methyladenine glycosylase